MSYAPENPQPQPTRPGLITRLKSRRWLPTVSALLAITAAILISIVSGWGAANTSQSANTHPGVAEVVTVGIPENFGSTAAAMPDVRGLDLATATQALVDAGIAADNITFVESPFAGAPGTIFQQSPAFGTRNPAMVQLLVATAVVMPDVAGRLATDVIGELQGYGARVTQVRVFDPDAVVGNAVRSNIAVGDPIPSTVVLDIADSGTPAKLEDLNTSGDYVSTGSVTVGGQSYDDTLSIWLGREDSSTTTWTIKGAVSQFVGTLAVDEDYTASVHVRIQIDSQVLYDGSLAPNQSIPIDLRFSGAQSFSITASNPDVENSTQLNIIDATFWGASALMAVLDD